MTDAQECLADSAINVAVFSDGGAGLVLVHLEADISGSATAEAAARGYTCYCGCFAVSSGVPTVRCEPGFEATMLYAGAAFAEMLGPYLKQQQLAARKTKG
jgi:hypothetical protein